VMSERNQHCVARRARRPKGLAGCGSILKNLGEGRYCGKRSIELWGLGRCKLPSGAGAFWVLQVSSHAVLQCKADKLGVLLRHEKDTLAPRGVALRRCVAASSAPVAPAVPMPLFKTYVIQL